MNLLSLTILFIAVSYGISNMVVFSPGPLKIFKIIRNTLHNIHKDLGELVSCMICFPTWVGIGLSVLNIIFFPDTYLTPFNVIFSGYDTDFSYVVRVLLDGALASGMTWLIHNIEEFFESRK